MADNMIELIAKLDYSESYKRISDQIRTLQNQLNNSSGISLNINPIINTSNISIGNIQDAIRGITQQYEDVQKIISAFGNTAPLQNQRTEIDRVKKDLESLKTTIDNVRKASEASANTPVVNPSVYKDISAFGTTGERLSSTAISEIAKAQIQSEIAIEDKVTRISKAAEDASGSLQKFFVQVERGDKSVETLTYQLNNQGNAFEYLGKTIREADNSTSAFKKVNLADQWKNQEQDLNKFVSDVGKANIANKQLAEGIEDLQARIAKGGDTNAMSDYIDKFNLVQASFGALKAESGRINAFNQLDASIRKASASLNAYAAKNQKAVTSTKLMADGTTTFAQRWAELNSQLNQPNLAPEQLRVINTQVAEFKKQAESAGLASKSLLTGMQSQLASVISRWFSLYGAIRIVRSITEEIKTLDDAMISLRRVTEATDEEFAKFRENAIGIAKEYGAAVSEVIDATATFSRSGFSLAESEELGRVATLYQNIGEGIGIEDASKTIVSVMKAFNIEAKDAETIIDKIINTANKASIDPEGLGASLQKTSAALVAANNTLDETIALITTANEIVQNPESVARGWQTVAMRIRGAKSELEDAGLDTEGMVESTSKLRDIILSMTGVDIMIDEDTFKSTYDIIKEIGVVWKDLSDIDQASLLETLAGKRQASIVAAALNNYTRLDEVLRLSTDSAGESAKAQEEVAKGITYAFEQVKIAFTELSEAFMSSDFLKVFAKSAQTALEVVTKLIKTFGTLPTLLGGVALGASFKNFGIFKTISSDVNAAGLQLTIFNQKWSTIKSNLTADNATLGQRIKGVFSGMFSVSDAELAALQRYSTQLNQVTTDEQRLAMQTQMLNAVQSGGSKMMQARVVEMNSLNNALKAGAISQEQYNARMQVLTTATQTTTGATAALNVGLNALKLTLNTVFTIGITMFISGFISKITELANASKEAEEKAREARDAAVERAKSYIEEADSMTDLQDEYIKLVTTTSDLTAEKERLLSIQDKLNDGISDQKEQVDLLNNSLSETLKLTREQRVEDASRTLAEQAPYYKEAVEDLQNAIEFSGELSNKWNDISRLDWGTTAFSKIQAIAGQAVSPTYKAAEHRGDIYISGFTINEGSLRENLEVLNKIISEYSVWDDANSEIITKLAETRDKYQKIYDAQSEIVKAYEEAQSIIDEDKAFAEKSEDYYTLIDNAQKAMQSFTELKKSGASPEEIRQSERILEQLQSQLIELVGNDVEARRTIASIFGSIDDNANQVEKDLRALQSSVDSLTTRFTELRKTFEDDVKDIDKIRSAIQDLAEGKTISRKDAWEIFDLDTEGILTDIRLVNGEYKLSASQLTSLMDSRIAKQKESIEVIKAEAEAEVQSAKVAVQLAEVRLKTATVNSAADVEYYKQYQKQLTQAQESLKAAEGTLRNANRMLADIENYGGDIVDYSKVLDAKTKEIDKNLKAQKADIDAQIKSIKVVVDQLEQEKDVLEQQKDALNEQKDSLEEIVKQYKDIASEVKSLTDEEKDALTKERDERKEYWSKQIDDSKEYYNAQIDALKEEHEAKKDIESLEKKKLDIQEKQLAVQEKQRELEEAREKRVRTYSASRGWTFMGDQDAIATAQKNFDEAQKNLVDAQKAYQDEVEENSFNAKIKNLENLRDAQNKLFEQQRDEEIKGLEKQIKAVEDYAKAWSKATDDVTTEEEERLAQELLGVDWREKIANKDLSIIDNFRVNFNRYNSQLKNLTDIEIKNLEKSIKAKDNEIKARKAEIDAWNAQKTEIENAANAMKETLEEYYNNLANANERIVSTADDTSIRVGRSFGEMVVDIWNAKENFSSFMGEMADNAEAEGNRMVKTAMGIANVFTKISDILEARKKANDIVSYVSSGHNIWDVLTGDKFAEGGVNTKTGFAWLDGTPKKPELVLNNADTAKLYNLIHNSNFVNYAPKPNSQPTNATARFDGATFVFNGVQNPQQFAQQMEVWISHETARSRVNGVGN